MGALAKCVFQTGDRHGARVGQTGQGMTSSGSTDSCPLSNLQVTSKFELYTCLSPLVTKAGAILVVTKLLRWVKKEEDRLFIRYPPKYSTPPAAPAASTDQPSHNGLFTGP